MVLVRTFMRLPRSGCSAHRLPSFIFRCDESVLTLRVRGIGPSERGPSGRGGPVSGNASRRNGEAVSGPLAIVAPERDLLFTEALIGTLPRVLRSITDAHHLLGFDGAIQACRLLRPAVVEVVIEESSSKEIIGFADELRRTCPDGHLIVIADDDEDVVSAVEAGAMAVVARSTGLEGLVDAIRSVADGATQLDAARLQGAMLVASRRRLAREDVSRRLEGLTERERDVLGLVTDGARNKDIASSLHISARTVDTHMTSVLRKLDVH